MRKNNMLTTKQSFDLRVAIRDRHERYQHTRPTIPAVSQEMSDLLGFEVTGHNVESALKDLDIWWATTAKNGQGPTWTRIAQIETEIADLKKRCAKLEQSSVLAAMDRL